MSVCPSDGALNKSVPSEIRGTTFAPLEPTSQVVKIRTFVFLPVGDLATATFRMSLTMEDNLVLPGFGSKVFLC